MSKKPIFSYPQAQYSTTDITNLDTTKPVILLDIDQVILDWSRAIASAYSQAVALMTDEDADKLFTRHMQNFYNGKTLENALGASRAKIFATIDGSQRYWEELPFLPFGPAIIDHLVKIKAQWLFVTSPTLCPMSLSGKLSWMQKHFGKGFRNFVITPHKHLLANPHTILVDDYGHNTKLFIQHGGTAVKVPSYGDTLFKTASDKEITFAIISSIDTAYKQVHAALTMKDIKKENLIVTSEEISAFNNSVSTAVSSNAELARRIESALHDY